MSRRRVAVGEKHPVRTTSGSSTSTVLVCPECGPSMSNLHHRDVIVFNRFREDSGGVRVDVPTTGPVMLTPVESAEIPGRRNSLRIAFSCECGRDLTLHLVQHKGYSLLSWEIGDVWEFEGDEASDPADLAEVQS